MIKIEKLNDLNSLTTINPYLRSYLLKTTALFCKQYNCSDISEFGTFFVLETEEDTSNHSAMGLSQPLSKTIFENVEQITIEAKDESITFVNALVLLNNDFGINIISEIVLLTDEIKERMFEEYNGERIIIRDVNN